MIVTGLVVVAVVIADQHKSLPRAASSGVVAAGTSSVLAGTSIDSDRMSGSGRSNDSGSSVAAAGRTLNPAHTQHKPKHPTPYTLYPTLYTRHPTPHTLHPTPQQVAAAGLKQIHGEMDIDKVEEIKMDLQEQLEISSE